MSAATTGNPLESVCVLRLSALGDVCHALAIVRTIQDAWASTRITWLIGKLEHRLLGHLPDVEFVVLDKKAGWRGYRDLRARLAGRRFEALLHMQLALRASLTATCVPARIRVGFDRARARELQWLVTNTRIEAKRREHVQDSFFGFTEALGIQGRSMRWDIPLPESARVYAERAVGNDVPTLIVSPCSSHVLRNWSPERYAAVADHAVGRHGMRVLICGGRSELELTYGARIAELMRSPVTNLVGKDTLLELLATLARATAVLTPDSGPAHMATTVGTPVLGLYAATNPARTGPYYSREWCVDRFDAAARRFLGRAAADVPWPTKIERPGVMDLIETGDVIERLDALMAAGAPRTSTGGFGDNAPPHARREPT
jgi:heptosyltransferase I